MTNRAKKPKWFTGDLYTVGGKATNPYTNESIELTALELSLYDFIVGCSCMVTGDWRNALSSTNVKRAHLEFLKAREWFRDNNPEAYQVLID